MNYSEILYCNFFNCFFIVKLKRMIENLIFRALQKRTNVNLKDVDYIIMGTVIQEVKTANIAREVNSFEILQFCI